MERIHELLAKGDPSQVAIRDFDGTIYTYADFSRVTEEIAGRLAAHGIRPGDRVMVLSENCMAFLASVLALSRLDAWVVLANARLTAPEVDRLVAVADIRSIIFTPEASPIVLMPVDPHSLKQTAGALFWRRGATGADAYLRTPWR